MDASGWCTEDAEGNEVCKGTDIQEATVVILSGTILSYPDGDARKHLTAAAVEVILDALRYPEIGGYDDPE